MTPAFEEETAVRVVFFDDMRGSTALKERLAKTSDEEAFHELRREHDALVTSIVSRDGGGEVIKSTGDGLIALFARPSVAVERALEIQERLHEHQHLRVRIGMDMGEIKVVSSGGRVVDVFGRHVDWAARACDLASDRHVCVTRPVYNDAFSWITKQRVAWKSHGHYQVKRGDPPLEIFEPYNANVVRPLRQLRGERVAAETAPARPKRAAATPEPAPAPPENISVIRPWEMVARDGRDFATNGAGAMYWFRVPLGGISYPEGFRSFLQPALENERITKIRFVLDGSETIREVWEDNVLRLIGEWCSERGLESGGTDENSSGRVLLDGVSGRKLSWIFVDLSKEFTPCFKLLVPDLDREELTDSEAQIFLSTASRSIRLRDGRERQIRIPDAVLRIRKGDHEPLLHALNAVANQWDSLFS